MIVNSGTLGSFYHAENQDAHLVAEVPGGVVMAVADGVGSHENSAQGAAAAVDFVLFHIKENWDNTDRKNLLDSAFSATRSYLLGLEGIENMGSTLVVSIHFEDGSWWVGTIGDSFAVINTDGRFTLAMAEQDGEFVNITSTVTGKKFNPEFFSGDGASMVAIASDGLFNATTTGNHPHGGFWKAVERRLEVDDLDVGGLLSHMASSALIDDDTTLLISQPDSDPIVGTVADEHNTEEATDL